ncbi:MAG: hypothetical protein JXM79_11775 [Sedimentisphaerales bacterium]|nr:hypothetical protein [Sedimentisphaerales bacterium]
MRSNKKGEIIIRNLESKKASAEHILGEICHDTALSELLGKDSMWAIVGGAVRDSLLATDPHTKPFFNPWPDVDVAVPRTDFDADKRLSQIEETQVSVKPNSFGGWKVSIEDVGELDVWKAKLGQAHKSALERWLKYLDHVDFAINAVAFLWPERTIAIHPRWQDSVEKCAIVRLSHNVMMEHLQPIRAIALAVKLKQTTNIDFRLGKEVLESLERLLTHKNEVVMRESLKYLYLKVSSGRWPRLVLDRFLEEVEKVSRELRFFQLVKEILEEDLISYAKSMSRGFAKNQYSYQQRRLFPRNPL